MIKKDPDPGICVALCLLLNFGYPTDQLGALFNDDLPVLLDRSCRPQNNLVANLCTLNIQGALEVGRHLRTGLDIQTLSCCCAGLTVCPCLSIG